LAAPTIGAVITGSARSQASDLSSRDTARATNLADLD
jgi:hypothetical protein